MRGWDVRTEALFSYVSCEGRVPLDHPLRPIQKIVDEALGALTGEFEKLYATFGRPSIPPEKLLRALLLQAFYSVRSERQLMEQLDYNLLFRWFVGLSLDAVVWDVTVFTKNRERLIAGDIADADWDRIFAVNIGAAFALSRAVAAGMKRAGSGRIVNISSGAGLGPSLTGIQAYCSAKHAVVGLTRQLAHELGPFGITVNSVAPGFVRSNPASERQWAGYGEEGQKALVERIAMKHLGTTLDIANARVS